MKFSKSALAIAACLATLTTGAALAQQKVVISMAAQPIGTLPQYSRVEVPLLRDELPKKSNGRIEMKLATWAERQVAGPEVLRLVRSGQLEIGGSPFSTVSGDVPFLDAADLSGLNPTVDQARRAADAIIPAANKELEKVGLRIIGHYTYSAQVFWCKRPINSLGDLQGKKVRTIGGSMNDLVGALGMQPVGLPFGEVYAALERGVVDCAVTGAGSGNAAKWFEVANGLYVLPIAWSVGAYYTNLAWWNKLDPQVRSLIEEQFKRVVDEHWKLGKDHTEDGIACNGGNAAGCKIGVLPAAGKAMQVKMPTDTDTAAMRKAFSEKVLPTWVGRCGARCGDIYNDLIAPVSGVKYTK
jgi:TRAP-type C4-dicarboxylate transport system substrate-binding protein